MSVVFGFDRLSTDSRLVPTVSSWVWARLVHVPSVYNWHVRLMREMASFRAVVSTV
jgi:hypothetical protein